MALRTVPLPLHSNVPNRELVWTAGCNLRPLLRRLTGIGTPGSHQGRAFSVAVTVSQRHQHRHSWKPDRVGRLTGTAAVSVHATSIARGAQGDPDGTSREPRRRCYGHRRGISLPKAKAPYQNAARTSRGAEGTTEASGRRDQAGLAARKRRVGAVRAAVPAQNEPKSDRPRAKTPMNRLKSRLRRRAAPIGNLTNDSSNTAAPFPESSS